MVMVRPGIKKTPNGLLLRVLAFIVILVTCSSMLRPGVWASKHAAVATNSGSNKKYRTVQVQIVHRHGDRTPITPMQDEEFWQGTLVPPDLLAKISEGTKVIRQANQKNAHAAGGRGPFGKLTQMGLLQMVDLGNTLRDDLVSSSPTSDTAIFGPNNPLHPSRIRILSTDFPRTIQSVQGVLVGLFPDGLGKDPATNEANTIDIDARHTSWLIPDPQPRRTQEQVELEAQIMAQPVAAQKERDMKPLAMRTTNNLRHLLAEGAFDMKFGVGEEINDGITNRDETPLPWAQLAEITKCLKVRSILPTTITTDDQEQIMEYLAQKWFDCLRQPRLGYLAMNKFASTITHCMRHHTEEPPLIIYSAHDSALIGLLCAFRLDKPSEWPPYASYLKIELVEVTEDNSKDYIVRFYLNGKLLPCKWKQNEALESIALDKLIHNIKTEGAIKTGSQ